MRDGMRAYAFHFSNKSRNGNLGRETHEHMDMVIYTANCQRSAAELAAFSGDYGVKRRLDFWCDQGKPIPGCPNAMQI